MKKNDFKKGLFTGAGVVIGLFVIFFGGMKLFNSMCFGFGKGVLNINQLSVLMKMNAIETIVDGNSYFDVDGSKVETMIYKGLIAGLGDKYAAYMTPDEYKAVKASNDGKYKGIGIKFDSKSEDGITIESVYKNSPAEKAGIIPGDQIKKVDGLDYSKANYSDVSVAIKTNETGKIELEIYRPSTDTSFTVEVEITDVEEDTTSSKVLEGNIGYIQIKGFQTVTYNQFVNEFEGLKEQGIKGLIIDLRNNPGGYVDTTLKILDYLLPECQLLRTERRGGKQKVYSSKESAVLDIPCVILTNEDSASASEIFAGAMKDNEAATLVGTKTYGKGIVQATYPLADGSAVKITVEKYFTPNGNDIHEKGIEPDVVVEKGEEGDAQLDKALELLGARD